MLLQSGGMDAMAIKISIIHHVSLHFRPPASFFWGGKTHFILIATPNVDNANRRQKKGKKLNYKLRAILMQKGIVVFIFANYLDDVLVWN
jgi:hypothetical protein